jgi:PhnB protein
MERVRVVDTRCWLQYNGLLDCGNILGRSGDMQPEKEKAPAGVSITPWLSVRNGARAVSFYGAAFGGVEVYRVEDPSGSVVSRLSIGGAEIWLSDESPEHGNVSPETLAGTSVKLLMTVPDPDSAFARAVATGAREVYPVTEGHGWRVGRVVDPFGHHWEIGRPVRDP